MKKIMILILALVSVVAFAQKTGKADSNRQTVDANNNILGAIASYGPDGANIGASSIVYNPPTPIDGTVYLFDDWYNNVVIVSAEEKMFKLNNINFNAKLNVFESQINKDSIFSYDFSNLDRIVVNNRTFKNVYSPIKGGYMVLEVLAESEDFSILKEYSIDIREGNPNPMLAQANDKYIMRDAYYIKKGKSFKRFKLKKSNILKAMGREAKVVESYAKENDLNFKDERDLYKIVTYYDGL